MTLIADCHSNDDVVSQLPRSSYWRQRPQFIDRIHTFCLVFINDRRPHSTIYRRGQSLSGCRCSYLEQFTPARHFCTFVACLPVTPQDSSLYHFLSQSVTMYSARAVTLVIWDTIIVHVTYLLTYLLTYLHGQSSSWQKTYRRLAWSIKSRNSSLQVSDCQSSSSYLFSK